MMTLTRNKGLQAVLLRLGAILAVCAATGAGFALTGQADMQPEVLGSGAASNEMTWTDAYNVSTSPDVDSEMPALAVTDSGIAHIVWEEGEQLYHSYRAASSWSEPSPIPGTGTGEQPALDAGPNDEVHLVYVNDPDVFYAAWDGSAWSLPKNVSQTSQVSDSPDVAVASDGSIHVVVVEQTLSGKQLYYARSADGSYWPDYRYISSAYGEGPAIDVAREDAIHIAYRSDGENDIYTLNGTIADWTLPQNISNTPDAFSTAPDLALEKSGAAEIVWQETINDTNQIQYSHGEDWIPVITLSSSSSGASMPSLAIDTFGHRHVAWDDEGFPFSIRHTWTSDPEIWPAPEILYASTLPLEDVALDVGRDGVVHAVWTEIHSGQGEILYTRKQFHDISNVFLPLVLRGG